MIDSVKKTGGGSLREGTGVDVWKLKVNHCLQSTAVR